MAIVTAILTFVALFLWAALLATCGTFTASDAAGNGLAEVWAVFSSFCLWASLAVILIIAGIKGRMAGRSIASAVVLVPASCAAAIAAIEILQYAGESRWTMIVPAVAPPLLLAYSAWLYFPACRAVVSRRLADGVTWTLLLALSLAPWPRTVEHRRERQAAAAQIRATTRAELAQHDEPSRRRVCP